MISESFDRVDTPVETGGGYTEIKEISPGLFRARKAGKFFILKTAKDSDARSLNLLRREYDLCANLSHPHIVSIFTFEEESPVGTAIVMEYVEGRTLGGYLNENPDKSSRRRIFLQLLDAVGYIHRSGLIHNDLKPANIIITNKDNDLKIIDFGLSDDDSNYLEKALGATAPYASPELLSHRTEKPDAQSIDSRSDIYSIGKIMQDIFPRNLRSIKSRCTRRNPEDRYANVEQLKRAYLHRNRPLRIAAAVLALLAILLPTALLLRQKSRLADANNSIAELKNTSDSLRLVSETLHHASDSLLQKTRQEEEFNRIRDSLILVIDNDLQTLYDKSLKLINKQWQRARSGEGGDPVGTQWFYHEGEDWGQFWAVDGDANKTPQKIHSMVQSLTLSPEKKVFLEDALTNHHTRLRDNLYQKLYDRSYNKYFYDYNRRKN